ncbi:hemagglutinin repeat-containing protein [uncultured Endozoicomonas sp.]|uniref:two-partner secretion domain-containing protein n=1 Tax=uncultured Endozoicomonas sp. TaxID=432652 RepID=UPI0026056B5F|nr:hemagglutinin repeat-containing protein [uncultured Endozoicomonas sp.]
MKKGQSNKYTATSIILLNVALQPVFSFAQIIPDDSQGRGPTVSNTDSNRPVVEINKPSAGGVSRNEYTQFDVERIGAVLNNNNTGKVLSISTGEGIAGNFNLIGGRSAQVILNEVTSTDRSLLEGATEVVGNSAQVVIANPNGITCNGCGFINTTRGVLTTGKPSFGGDGALQRLRVSSGDILVGEDGLNASEQARLDLIAGSVSVKGSLWAKQLNVISGNNNEVDYQKLTTTPVQLSDKERSAIRTGIDVASLGGMYADKIYLVSTGAGVGVNSRGAIGAELSDIQISSDGKVVLSGEAVSAKAGDINILNASDIEIDAKAFYASGNVNLNADRDVDIVSEVTSGNETFINNKGKTEVSGSVNSGNGADISSGALINRGSILAAAGDIDITTDGNITSSGVFATKKGDINLNAGKGGIELQSNNGSDDLNELDAEGNISIVSSDDIRIGSNKDVDVELVSRKSISISTPSSKLTNHGSVLATGNLSVTVGELENTKPAALAASEGNADFDIKQSLINAGSIQSDRGDVTAKSGGKINNSGKMYAYRILNLRGSSISNSYSGSVVSRDQAFLRSSGAFYNSGFVNAASRLNVEASNITNAEKAGLFSSEGSISAMSRGDISNLGSVHAKNDIELILDSTSTDTSTITQGNGAYLNAGRSLSIGLDCELDENGQCHKEPDFGSAGKTVFQNNGVVSAGSDIFVQLDVFNNSIDSPGVSNNKQEIKNSDYQYVGNSGKYGGVQDNTKRCESEKTNCKDGYYVSGAYSAGGQSFYVDWNRLVTYKERFTSLPDSNRPALLSHGNITIRTNDGDNTGGTLSATNEVNILGADKQGSIFLNASLERKEYIYRQSGRTRYGCVGTGCTLGYIHEASAGEFNVSPEVLSKTRVIETIGGVIQGKSVNVDGVGQFINVGEQDGSEGREEAKQKATKELLGKIQKTNQINASEASQNVDKNNSTDTTNIPGFGSLPIGKNSFFAPAAPESLDLYVTRPELSYNNPHQVEYDQVYFDQLKDSHNLASDTIVIGDPLFQEKLIQDQLIHQTGRAFLSSPQTTEQELTGLITNGVNFLNENSLTPGQPLTNEQRATLTHDVIWYEYVNIGGRQVLTPKVYLANDYSSKGIIADTATFNVSEFVNDGGNVDVKGELDIATENDLINDAGTIKGGNIQLTSKDGSVINRSEVVREFGFDAVEEGDNYQDKANVGSITATGSLNVHGQKGVDNIGGQLSGNSVELLSAEGDVNLESLTLETRKSTLDVEKSAFYYSREETSETKNALLASGVSAGSGGLTVSAEQGDVVLKGAEVSSEGGAAIHGKNVISKAIDFEHKTMSSSYSAGINTNTGDIGVSGSSASDHKTTGVGSSLNIKGNLTVNADEDISIEGGNITAGGDARLTGENVELVAADSSQVQESESYSVGLNVKNATFGITDKEKSEKSTSGHGVNVSLGGSLDITAKDQVLLEGGQYNTQGGNLAGKDVKFAAAESTYETHEESYSLGISTGASVGIGGEKAGVSANTGTGKYSANTSSSTDFADKTGKALNKGKAISDELASAKAGVSIDTYQRDAKGTTYKNGSFNFADTLNINAENTVDLGGTNIKGESDSQLAVRASDIETTKYVDTHEEEVIESSTFVGFKAEGHSAVVDAVNHSKVLADKALKEGMEVDAGLTAAQAAGDVTNLIFGDIAGGSVSAAIETTVTERSSKQTSENTNTFSAGNISFTATGGDIALAGVELDGSDSVQLKAKNDVSIRAAKATSESDSTTHNHALKLSLDASTGVTGTGAGISVGYDGSISNTEASATTYTQSSITGANVTIDSGNDFKLEGGNVKADSLDLNFVGDVEITTVQDTSHSETTNANWGASVGASINSNTLVAPTVTVSAGGGKSWDNSAITKTQSGISAGTIKGTIGGDLELTGAQVVADSGQLNVSGDVIAQELKDSRDKDGNQGGGSVGWSHKGAPTVSVNYEKDDRVKYSATQKTTINIGGNESLQVSGSQIGNINTDIANTVEVTEDRKIAGNIVSATISVDDTKELIGKVKSQFKGHRNSDSSSQTRSIDSPSNVNPNEGRVLPATPDVSGQENINPIYGGVPKVNPNEGRALPATPDISGQENINPIYGGVPKVNPNEGRALPATPDVSGQENINPIYGGVPKANPNEGRALPATPDVSGQENINPLYDSVLAKADNDQSKGSDNNNQNAAGNVSEASVPGNANANNNNNGEPTSDLANRPLPAVPVTPNEIKVEKPTLKDKFFSLLGFGKGSKEKNEPVYETIAETGGDLKDSQLPGLPSDKPLIESDVDAVYEKIGDLPDSIKNQALPEEVPVDQNQVADTDSIYETINDAEHNTELDPSTKESLYDEIAQGNSEFPNEEELVLAPGFKGEVFLREKDKNGLTQVVVGDADSQKGRQERLVDALLLDGVNKTAPDAGNGLQRRNSLSDIDSLLLGGNANVPATNSDNNSDVVGSNESESPYADVVVVNQSVESADESQYADVDVSTAVTATDVTEQPQIEGEPVRNPEGIHNDSVSKPINANSNNGESTIDLAKKPLSITIDETKAEESAQSQQLDSATANTTANESFPSANANSNNNNNSGERDLAVPIQANVNVERRVISLEQFKKNTDLLFSERKRISAIDKVLSNYDGADSRSSSLTNLINVATDYLEQPGKHNKKREKAVRELIDQANQELDAWRSRERAPLPGVVFRMDERSPELIAKTGFQPWNKDGSITIIEHVTGVLEQDRAVAPSGDSESKGILAKKHSQFVSTAADLSFAKDPVLLSGLLSKTLYKIDTTKNADSFTDVGLYFDRQKVANPFEKQREFVQKGGIDAGQVTHYTTGAELVDFVTGSASADRIKWYPLPKAPKPETEAQDNKK